jgi:hypothetical protein
MLEEIREICVVTVSHERTPRIRATRCARKGQFLGVAYIAGGPCNIDATCFRAFVLPSFTCAVRWRDLSDFGDMPDGSVAPGVEPGGGFDGRPGITEASTTRSASTPSTRSSRRKPRSHRHMCAAVSLAVVSSGTGAVTRDHH